MIQMDLDEINKKLSLATPQEIVLWALEKSNNPIVTTNFRPYEGAILHLVSTKKSDIPVVWCDTGYNTVQTYKHADFLIKQFDLNIDLYVPKQTKAHRDAVLGLPGIDDPNHSIFAEQVKLEPFKRAMNYHKPDFWFTNLRKGQTAFRDNIDIVSLSSEGIVKVSPFYHYSDEDLDAYLEEYKIPNETKYFDPTKVLGNRECGIHT